MRARAPWRDIWRKAVSGLRLRLPEARRSLDGLLDRLARLDPAEPETQVRERFESIEAATFTVRRFGLAIVVLFLGVGGLWAALAPLSSAAIAPGVVSPKSSRQTVQHLEGGIIRDILVAEGAHVTAGQKLVVLEDVGARTDVDRLRSRYHQLIALESRLLAERDATPDVAFNETLMRALANPEVREIIDVQLNQFQTRRANDDSRKAILRQRIAQLEEQIGGLEQQLASAHRQDALVDEEIASVGELVRKGLERKSRLLSLERGKAELLGQQGGLKAQIAQAREAIGETQLEIMKTDIERTEQVDAELAEVQAQRTEVEQQLKEREDRLARTAIVAPVAGIVIDLRFKTTGGVIRPGENVVDIVPTADSLVIDARVSPKDIDQVRPGLVASVVFPAYRQRTLPRLDGEVTQVSPDSLLDERTGERYYAARIEVDREHLLTLAPRIELQPGMMAEAFIATGDRTMLGYLLGPFFDSLRRSFREA